MARVRTRGARTAVAAAILATAVSLSGCVAGSEESGPTTLRIAEGAEQPSLDPVLNLQFLSDELQAIYDTLVIVESDGSIGPSLAESWEIDGASITFNLRDDVTFHDGTPFNAEAVKAHLDRVVDPDVAAANSRSVLGPYESSEVIDEFTVKVTWQQPVGGALVNLANADLSIPSPTAVEAGTLEEHPVGTGPYKFVEYVKGDHLTLERNEDYTTIRTDLTNKGAPKFDQLIFSYVTNASARANLLATGATDVTRLEGTAALRFENDPNVTAQTFPSISEMWMAVNVRVVPDILVRQAISAAIDREAIIKGAASGYGDVQWSAVPSSVPGFAEGIEDIVPQYDPDAARDLLAQAGYVEGPDGFVAKDGVTLEFQIISPSEDPYPAIDQLVQDQLAQVGIKTTIATQEFASMIETRRQGAQGIYIGTYGILDAAGAMKILFTCGNIAPENPRGNNLTFNCNPELDAVIEAAVVELDESKRNELLAEAQRLLAEDHASFVLYQRQTAVFSTNAVTGIDLQFDGILKINDIVPAG